MTNGHLSSLRAHLADERAREADARPSRTTDDELDRAIERVTRADAALAEGQVDVAAREMAELAYVAGDSGRTPGSVPRSCGPPRRSNA